MRLHKLSVLLAVFGPIAVGVLGSQGYARGSQIEHSIQLFVLPQAIEPAYGNRVFDQSVFFVDEPVELLIQLRNRTGKEVLLNDGPNGWPSLLQFRFADAKTNAVVAAPAMKEVRRSRRQGGAQDGTLLLPSRSEEAVVSIAQRGLVPGTYNVEVTLSRNILPSGTQPWDGRALIARRTIEVREAATKADLLDQYLNLAVRARWDRQYGQAREWLDMLLQLNPTSVVAFAESAALWRAQGDCQRAVESYERALTILANRSDPEHSSSQTEIRSAGLASSVRSSMAECGVK